MPEELKRSYIVQEHPVRIISKCRSHSKGTLTSFLVGFCVLYAIINWVPYILSIFFPTSNLDVLSRYAEYDPEMLAKLPSTPMVSIIYLLMFNGVFKFCECLYTLTYIRNRKADYRALTEGMSYYLKTLGVFLMQVVIISFWTMFFIIPGLLAALNFSQAFYILADDPDKRITEVLAESKIMMYGNRMNYVRLMLYYVPYFMAAYIPAFILAGLTADASLGTAGSMIISMIADIPMFIAYGYMSLGRTVFYELMINRGFAEFRYAGQEAFRELEN